MPVRKQDAHRALELLEDFHSKLTVPEDRQLKEAIERIITIFKSSLFKALLDIQEFYEEILLNDRKSLAQKTNEINQVAAQWEINPPIVSPGSVSSYYTQKDRSMPDEYVSTSTTIVRETTKASGTGRSSSAFEERMATTTSTPYIMDRPSTTPYSIEQRTNTAMIPGGTVMTNGGRSRTPVGSQYSPATYDHWMDSSAADYHRTSTSAIVTKGDRHTAVITPTHMDHREVFSPTAGQVYVNGNGLYTEEWEYEDVVLEKGTIGLGLSIAGGNDTPHYVGDPSIYVTKIIPGGAAQLDGRMHVDDIILRVNTTDTVDVSHHVAVEALKNSGNVVKLFVKRRRVRGRTPSPVRIPSPVRVPSPTIVRRPSSPVLVSPVHLPPRAPSQFSTARPSNTIELIKGSRGLGFSIAGGKDNEHIQGDPGIFITKIFPGGAAQIDGRLQVDDRLLAVNNVPLENVTHSTAVAALRSTPDRVVLVVERSAGYGNTGYAPTTPLMQTGSRTPQPIRHEEPLPYKSSSFSTLPRTGTLEPTREPRTLSLNKGPTGLGFNIVGGEENTGIFITHILPGGVADLSGSLFKGDQLLQVNGEDLTFASHQTAALALKNSGPRVNIVAQYKPEEYRLFEVQLEEMRDKMINQNVNGLAGGIGGINIPTEASLLSKVPISAPVVNASELGLGISPPPYPAPRRELYVRAMFDFEPCRDSGLPSRGLAFRHGDILHVTNASDDEWWRARRVRTADGRHLSPNDEHGIIPSKRRVEKRERARRKQVNFTNGRQQSFSEKHSSSKKSLSLSRKFPFMKSKERMDDESDFDRCEEPIMSYEIVEEQKINFARPVILLGALKDRFNDDLIAHNAEAFGSCVPHTSRPRKDHEMQGRDYYFVTKEDMDRDIQQNLFVEAGSFNGNLYGTSIRAVRDVAQRNKHCILDVSGNAIRRLQTVGLYPIAILIKPLNWQQLQEWNKRMPTDEAQAQFQKTLIIEQEFNDLLTAIVQGDTVEEIYSAIQQIIRDQAGPYIWVPSNEQLASVAVQ